MPPLSEAEIILMVLVVSGCFVVLPSDYHYLRFVDLGTFAKQFGKFLATWLGLTAAYLAYISFFGTEDSSSSWLSFVPGVVWIFVWVPFVTWLLSHGGKFELPATTTKQWMAFNFCFVVFGLVLLATYGVFGKIAYGVVALGVYRLLVMYEKLVSRGKENFETLYAPVDSPR
jgi:hypothetical protein